LGYNLFNRHCDICKDFRLEIPAINSRNLQSRAVADLEISETLTAAISCGDRALALSLSA